MTLLYEEVRKDGKKHCIYTSKNKKHKPCREPYTKEKKMAAYCRVSTDQLEQLSSYEA